VAAGRFAPQGVALAGVLQLAMRRDGHSKQGAIMPNSGTGTPWAVACGCCGAAAGPPGLVAMPRSDIPESQGWQEIGGGAAPNASANNCLRQELQRARIPLSVVGLLIALVVVSSFGGDAPTAPADAAHTGGKVTVEFYSEGTHSSLLAACVLVPRVAFCHLFGVVELGLTRALDASAAVRTRATAL
jgi:hypothetical protein